MELSHPLLHAPHYCVAVQRLLLPFEIAWNLNVVFVPAFMAINTIGKLINTFFLVLFPDIINSVFVATITGIGFHVITCVTSVTSNVVILSRIK